MPPSTYHVSLQECSVVRLAAKLWTTAAMIKRLNRSNVLHYKNMPPQLINAVKMKVIDLSTLNADSKNKIQALIKPVGDSLLGWIKGHYEFFDSMDAAISFTSHLCWLPDGTVDNRATAELLLEYEEVDLGKRFVLACIYCFEAHIFSLWKQLKTAGNLYIDKETAFKYPLANYWLEFLKHKSINQIEPTPGSNRPLQPPSTTSEAKVEFPDDDATDSVQTEGERYSVDTSPSTVSEEKSRVLSLPKPQQLGPIVPVGANKKVVKIVDTKCFCQKVIMCPQDNLMDVLLNYAIQAAIGNEPWTNLGFKYGGFVQFLFSLANIRQRITKMEMKYEVKRNSSYRPPTCFLEWPLQWFFLDTVTEKWVFFTVEMCHIHFGKIVELLRSSAKPDYRELFLQVWNNTTVSQWALKMNATNEDGLEKLCGVMPWDDPLSAKTSSAIHLAETTLGRRKSEAMIKLYSSIHQLIVIQKLDFIQELVDNCLPPTDEFSKRWKSEFMFSFDGVRTVASLIQRGKWEAIETLLTWSLPNPQEIAEFNRYFISSPEGCKLCMDYVTHDEWDSLRELLERSLTNEDDMKKSIKNRIDLFFDYATDNHWKAVEKNLMWCLFDAQDIKEFRIKFLEKCTKSEIWHSPDIRAKETVQAIFSRLLEAKGPEYYQETFLITFVLLFLISAFYFLR